MSVLSRPDRRRVTAPTQREVRVPLSRTSADPDDPTLRVSPQTTQLAPMSSHRSRTIVLVGGALAAALATGVGTYLLVEDDGGSTVIAPSVSRVPSAADLGRDAATAARGPAGAGVSDAARSTEAQRDAALSRRAQN